MTVEEIARDWLDHCRAQGKLASTMHGYRYAIEGIFLPFCAREGLTEPAELSQKTLNELGRELLSRTGRNGQPISKFTVDAYLRPIRHMLNWAAVDEGIEVDGRPLLPRKGKPRPKDVLSREEIQRMEDAAYLERDKLIIRLLADTGMRIGELCRLRPGDLMERNRQWFVYVRGKGENDRIVPIPRIYRRLQRWVERGRPQPCADAIFVTVRGVGFYPALKYSGAYEVVRGSAEMAGIRKRVHPHLLRHSLITTLRRKGHNDAQISLVVGNFNHLDDYTHLDAGDAYGLVADLD